MQEETMNELPDTDRQEQLDSEQPQVARSRRKRSVTPIVGMPCEPGFKLVGENCVMANVLFE